MKAQVANNAVSVLASSVSASDTSFSVAAGQGTKFPADSGGSYFYVRVGDDALNEVVKCTSRTTDAITCEAFTLGWDASTPVALTVCKELFDELPRTITGDVTYTVKTSGGTFTTLDAALAALKDVIITSDAVVTLEIDSGTWVHSATITDAILCSNRIKLKGKSTYTGTVNSVQSSSGSAGAWSVVLNVASVANVAIGDYMLVGGATGGTNPTYLDGVHKVTSVDAINTRITVLSMHRAASAPASTVTATYTILKTALDFSSANITAFQSTNGRGFYGIEQLAIAGGNSGVGLYATEGGRFILSPTAADVSVGIYGFSNGVAATRMGFLDVSYAFISGGSSNNVSATTGGVVMANHCNLSGGNSEGISATLRSFVYADSCTATGAGGSYIAYANICSTISLASATTSSPTSLSPTSNTIANENSYINT